MSVEPCPVCDRRNRGYFYEVDSGNYRFSDCGHTVPTEPKQEKPKGTIREIFKEAGGFKYLEGQNA
jgi:hypothetical protein